jgi:hypothetical protein
MFRSGIMPELIVIESGRTRVQNAGTLSREKRLSEYHVMRSDRRSGTRSECSSLTKRERVVEVESGRRTVSSKHASLVIARGGKDAVRHPVERITMNSGLMKRINVCAYLTPKLSCGRSLNMGKPPNGRDS